MWGLELQLLQHIDYDEFVGFQHRLFQNKLLPSDKHVYPLPVKSMLNPPLEQHACIYLISSLDIKSALTPGMIQIDATHPISADPLLAAHSFILQFLTTISVATRIFHIAEPVVERIIAVLTLSQGAIAAISEVSDFVAVFGGHHGGGEEEGGKGEEVGEMHCDGS